MGKRQTGTVPKIRSYPSKSTIPSTCIQSFEKSSTPKATSLNKSKSHKNTEVVAPTRRELNDLNDYLFSVTESTKHQNSTPTNTHLVNWDIDNYQRYCWPVRPIPRRNLNNKEVSDITPLLVQNVNSQNQGNLIIHSNCNTPSNTSAAVGIVIPTTPASSNLSENYGTNRTSINSNIENNQYSEEDNRNNSNPNSESNLIYHRELNILQHYLSLFSTNQNTASDTAHSVTSLHTGSEPNTPTSEELQLKLESSARNIQNIREQQQHLLKLQQSAKQQLQEMENIRKNQCQQQTLLNQNKYSPSYETVGQVHSDMSTLVNRIKNLQTFIHGQNEISELLGDDSPDILKEQMLLRKNLQELKSQRQEMKNLVGQFQDVNTTTERAFLNQQNELHSRNIPVNYMPVNGMELLEDTRNENREILVKPEFYNNAVDNICVTNENRNYETLIEKNEINPENVTDAAELIKQKMADINTMKIQLKHLKDMMDTVKLIENRTVCDCPKVITNETALNEFDNNLSKNINTSVINPNKNNTITGQEQELSEKVRLLHEMTQDLRNQADNYSSEHERLRFAKEELQRHGDNLRNFNQDNLDIDTNIIVSPIIQPLNGQSKNLFKLEYDNKKNDKLNDHINNDGIEEMNISELNLQSLNKLDDRETWNRFQPNEKLPTNSIVSQQRGKDSADSGAVDVNGITSIEAGSIQSGSSRSFIIPQPMQNIISNDNLWNKNQISSSQSQYQDHFVPQTNLSGGWNSNYCYGNICPHQYNNRCHHSNLTPNTGNICNCSHQHHNDTSNSNRQSTQNVSTNNNDSIQLQQIIQTQQMLINSICQCNQLVWRQQMEINNLNNSVMTLQERLFNANTNETVIGNRNESVPSNTQRANSSLYYSLPTVRSELPQQIERQSFLTIPMLNGQYNTCSCNTKHTTNSCNTRTAVNIRYPHFEQPNQTFLCTNNLGSQYRSIHQEHTTAANNNITQPQSSPRYLNNDNPQVSANIQQHNNITSTPILMNHHNNITSNNGNINTNLHEILHSNNNSNLLNSQQNDINLSTGNIIQNETNNTETVVTSNNNAAAVAAALNNKVAPGNRANNYWDNFRSYSRQNLLSSGSCKSNEDQHTYQQYQTFQQTLNGIANSNGQRIINQHPNTSNSLNILNTTTPSWINKYATLRNHFCNTDIENQEQTTCDDEIKSQHQNISNSDILNDMRNSSEYDNQEHQFSNTPTFLRENRYDDISEPKTLGNNGNLMNIINNETANTYLENSDLRNMNFNCGRKELKKKNSSKTSCNSKCFRQTAQINMNDIQRSNYITSDTIGSINIASNENLSQEQIDDSSGYENTNNESSEQIQRNLLVNALKNDKFTSKFFECLKEDVYREVYSIIQATESQPKYLIQLFKELQLVSTSDPIRNIILQVMHDLYKRYCTIDTDKELKNSDGLQDNIFQMPIKNTQNNIEQRYNDTTAANNNSDSQFLNCLLNSEELRRVAYKIMFESSANLKKTEKSQPNEDFLSQRNSNSKPPKLQNKLYQPDNELITYVMENIRNTLQIQYIDNETIIKIAKLTYSYLENPPSFIGSSSFDIDHLLISPKELYKKMKTFDLRDPEEFLKSYETYLQSILIVKVTNEDIVNVRTPNKQILKNNSTEDLNSSTEILTLNDDNQIGKKLSFSFKSNIPCSSDNNSLYKKNELQDPMLKTSGDALQKNLITSADVASVFNEIVGITSSTTKNQIISNNRNIMNGDLAEADQICSSNTTNAESSNVSNPYTSILLEVYSDEETSFQQNSKEKNYADLLGAAASILSDNEDTEIADNSHVCKNISSTIENSFTKNDKDENVEK